MSRFLILANSGARWASAPTSLYCAPLRSMSRTDAMHGVDPHSTALTRARWADRESDRIERMRVRAGVARVVLTRTPERAGWAVGVRTSVSPCGAVVRGVRRLRGAVRYGRAGSVSTLRGTCGEHGALRSIRARVHRPGLPTSPRRLG